MLIKETDYWALRRIRMIADYQFSSSIGSSLFPRVEDVSISRKTGKIKEISEGKSHIATLNPRSGTFSLSMEGARRLVGRDDCPCITIKDEFILPISRGGNVFAKHVAGSSNWVHPSSETIVTSEASRVLAVGRSLLSSEEAKRFKHGIAIKVRRGVNSKDVPSENGSQNNAQTHGQNGTET